jgi:2-dehydro-3-deoxy-D-arabinonate dehydratase
VNLCRFEDPAGRICSGLVTDDVSVQDISSFFPTLSALLESDNLTEVLAAISQRGLPRHPLTTVRLLAPVDHQEIWAAGVTYLRSKKARMDESDFSAAAYDKVYEAARPELFFKSLAEKVVSPGDAVGIRRDAKWNVPEPELVLVLNSRGRLAGFTIGNDMSSRDIEGENLLYLPQAKIYTGSCALGPTIRVGASEEEARAWTIDLTIERSGARVFAGATTVGQIKRPFAELAAYLFRSQAFPRGAMMLTGTGIIPPDTFTLEAGDVVRIKISGIGELENTVRTV